MTFSSTVNYTKVNFSFSLTWTQKKPSHVQNTRSVSQAQIMHIWILLHCWWLLSSTNSIMLTHLDGTVVWWRRFEGDYDLTHTMTLTHSTMKRSFRIEIKNVTFSSKPTHLTLHIRCKKWVLTVLLLIVLLVRDLAYGASNCCTAPAISMTRRNSVFKSYLLILVNVPRNALKIFLQI